MKLTETAGKKLSELASLLNLKSWIFYAGIFLIWSLSASAAIVARYNWNVTALVRFGYQHIEENPELTPPGVIRFLGNEANGGNGYDGQIFYYYARALFVKETWPIGFSNAYRAPRAGYPLLGAILLPFGSMGVLAGLLIFQILVVCAGIYCVHRLLHPDFRYLTLLYVLSPFLLQSFVFVVSDGVMISLCMIGLYFSRRSSSDTFSSFNTILSALAFALAILTKESSLFLLFPLGLFACYKRNWILASTLLAALVPAGAWQLYLYKSHGMVPASVLKIFFSPLSGIAGVIQVGLESIRAAASNPFSGLLDLFKQSAKWILILILPFSGIAALVGIRERFTVRGILDFVLPYRAAYAITALSIICADYQYFWGIFENIGRMFTMMVPALILAVGSYGSEVSKSNRWFFLTVALILGLAILVWFRFVFMTQTFPYDVYIPYTGPVYPSAPVPGRYSF